MNKREQLAQWTSLVADTGDLDMIAELAPEDATTNPSLLLAAARDERYRPLLQQAADLCRTLGHGGEMDWLTRWMRACPLIPAPRWKRPVV